MDLFIALRTRTSSKILWSLLLLVTVVLIFTLRNTSESNKYTIFGFPIFKTASQPPKRRYCYQDNSSAIIFLHVTNKSDEWHPIEMCAFRTAALLNNDTGVCVLTKSQMKSHPSLALLSNLEFGELNSEQLFKNTPLEQWYNDYALNDSLVSNLIAWELSDGLRLAYLYKYGGKYMDTDSWTLRNLAPLQNVAGWHVDSIANGVLFFEKGHGFVKAALEAFPKYFSAGVWGSVGPQLITTVHNSGIANSSVYTVVEPHVFYPLLWPDFLLPFEANQTDYVKSTINGSYTMHMYRYMIEKYASPYPIPPPKESFADEFFNNNCSIDNW